MHVSPDAAALARVLSRYEDHEAFCSERLRIRDKRGQVVPVRLYPGPRRLHELIRRIQGQRRPVRVCILKARQMFMSAGIAAQFSG